MNLRWSAADLAFRDEVRRFLDGHLTDEVRNAGSLMTSAYPSQPANLAWQRILHARGWAAPAWPVEYGGAGWSVMQRYIFARERAAAGAPPLSPMGLQMCGPALIGHGTAEQKAFFLPRMLSGEHFWCQGYSEPDAGSDLAALKMPAIDDGDAFICTGTKVWTTHAQHANWIFCLVRTSTHDKPQRGITFLLVDMRSPGVSVEPIVSPSGENIQNRVHFDRVRVPKTNVVGGIGAGWTVAKFLLEFERGGSAYSPDLLARFERIARFAAQQPGDRTETLAQDEAFARKLSAARIRIAALESYEFCAMSEAEAGGSPGASGSVMKLLGTELSQLLTELALEAAGHHGRAYQPQAGCPGGAVMREHGVSGANDAYVGAVDAALAPLRYFGERAGSIYAGSNEIQRNILAKAALGL